MITYHPAATKAHGALDTNGKRIHGFKPMVMLRNAHGQMVGSKTSALTIYANKVDARNAAREACHVALESLARDYPQFIARVA
jgi:hypothetical protein